MQLYSHKRERFYRVWSSRWQRMLCFKNPQTRVWRICQRSLTTAMTTERPVPGTMVRRSKTTYHSTLTQDYGQVRTPLHSHRSNCLHFENWRRRESQRNLGFVLWLRMREKGSFLGDLWVNDEGIHQGPSICTRPHNLNCIHGPWRNKLSQGIRL